MQPEITVFFDGDCPLCVREIRMLERLDAGRGRIGLVDIASPDFRADDHGRGRAELMARIQGRLPDGRWVEGMEVFRRVYAGVGLGWLMAPTGWPLLRPLFDAAYRWFARNRLWLTGRGDACDSGACELPSQASPTEMQR